MSTKKINLKKRKKGKKAEEKNAKGRGDTKPQNYQCLLSLKCALVILWFCIL